MTVGSYVAVHRDGMQYVFICEKDSKSQSKSKRGRKSKKKKLVKLVSTYHTSSSLTKCIRGQYKSSVIKIF